MLGDKIKKIRLNSNMGLNETARKANISCGYLSSIENNKRTNVSIDILHSIANALSVPVNEFFDEPNIKKNTPDKIIEQDLPTIPKQFTNANEARAYINKHQIFGANGFNSNKLDNDEVLEFANELLRQMEIISYKYKK